VRAHGEGSVSVGRAQLGIGGVDIGGDEEEIIGGGKVGVRVELVRSWWCE
jgi:hypothetical protein